MEPGTGIAPTSLRRHGVAGWSALILSLALHALLLSRLPPLLFDQWLDQPLFPDYPAIALGQVERNARTTPEPLARFRPENPEEVAQVWGEADIALALGQEGLPAPAAPALPSMALVEQSGPVAAPPAADVPPAWDAREEILQIERPQLDDRAAAQPRRYRGSAPALAPGPAPDMGSEWTASTGGPVGGGNAPMPVLPDTSFRPGGAAMGAPDGQHLTAALAEGTGPAPGPDWSSMVKEVLSESSDVRSNVEEYLTLSLKTFRAPEEPGATYFEMVIARRSEMALPVLPKDVLLVQDCSESMTPWKLAECKRGLARWIDQLNPGDRFEILAFRDNTTRCFGEWQPISPQTRARAMAFIDDLRAVGNTDVYASLQAALGMATEPGRPVIVALVTDGRPTTGVTEGSSIIDGFTRANQGGLSVFGVGGGPRVNRFLLDLISYWNRGESLLEDRIDRIPYAMERWGGETRRPVLTGLTYQFSGLSGDQVYPSSLTHLYLDRPLNLVGRIEGALPDAAVQIAGFSGGQARDMVFPLAWGQAITGDESLRTRWAWHRIYHEIGRYLQSPGPEQLLRIQELANRYGLKVPYGFGESLQTGPLP